MAIITNGNSRLKKDNVQFHLSTSGDAPNPRVSHPYQNVLGSEDITLPIHTVDLTLCLYLLLYYSKGWDLNDNWENHVDFDNDN